MTHKRQEEKTEQKNKTTTLLVTCLLDNVIGWSMYSQKICVNLCLLSVRSGTEKQWTYNTCGHEGGDLSREIYAFVGAQRPSLLWSVWENTAKSDECQLHPGYRSALDYWESVCAGKYCLARGTSPTAEWTEIVGTRPMGLALAKARGKPVQRGGSDLCDWKKDWNVKNTQVQYWWVISPLFFTHF